MEPFLERGRVLGNQNASAAVIVRQLLATLEQSTLREDAQALRQRFEQQGWNGLSALDIARVAALVGQLQALPVGEPTPAAEPAPPLARPTEPVSEEPPPWSPLDNAEAWVDAVPQGRALLALLAELARCDDADEAAALLTRLFVEHLRYEAYAMDETARLDSSETILRLRTLARHDTFVVSLAELSFPYTYPSIFQPIFRRHPYGLVVAIAPGWNACQFAYRAAKDVSSLVQRTRQLVGLLEGDEVQDSLVLWVKRMDLLRPQGGEDGAALVRRAEEALDASPTDVTRRWLPVPLTPKAPPPGAAWSVFYQHERRAFLQEKTPLGARRVLWGLERALRVAFPFGLSQRRGRLCYRGYTLGEANSPEAAFRMGGSWVRRLTLELELVLEEGTVLPLSLAASVPEMDERGFFLIDGRWLRWVPRVLAEGLLVGTGSASLLERVVEEGEELELDEELALPELEGGPPRPEDEVAEPELEPTEQLLKEFAPEPTVKPASVRGNPLAFAGASLCTLLEMAAYRKLFSARAKVAAYEGEARDLPKSLGVLLRGLLGRDESLLLVSRAFLKAFLEPAWRRGTPEDELPILRQSSAQHAGHPPAWACPEVSATLPAGTWLPVAGARVTPCGELAVPLRDEEAERLRVSTLPLHRVNPRAGGEGRESAPLWISEGLSRFAFLPAGRVRDAASFAAHGHPLPEGLRVLHVRGDTLRARMLAAAPMVPPPVRQRQLQVRIPMLLVKEEKPRYEFLLARGARVAPGTPWLRADPEAWALDSEKKLGGHLFRHHEVVSCSFIAEVLTRKEPPAKRKGKGREDAADGDETEEEETAGLVEDESASSETSSGEEEDPAPVLETEPLAPPRFLLPEVGEWWYVPPGVQGTVLDVLEEVERDKAGMEQAWRLTLVVALSEPDVPWGHLLLPDGRSVPWRGDMAREEAPFGDDGVPVQLVIEDPSLSGTPLTEVWFQGESGELLETATSRMGSCLVVWGGEPVTRPDERLRFRARDGEGIPAHRGAAALSSAERLWWTAVRPEAAAAVARVERSWSGGLPPFLRHLVEVLEAAHLEPPMFQTTEPLEDIPPEWRKDPLGALQAMQLRKWATTYENLGRDAPLRWSCRCGLKTGRARAFEKCGPALDCCGTAVLLRPALRGRRSPPVIRLHEPVLHPWRKETAAGLLGLTVPELEWRCVTQGPLLMGILMSRAVRGGDPGAAVRERLGRTTSLPEREALLRGLRAVEKDVALLGAALPGRLLLASLPMLVRALQPTGVPRGAPGSVKSPLTMAYLRVRAAAVRLKKLRASGSRHLVETARRSLQAEVDALFGSVPWERHAGEPTSLSGLLARLWPLTRASHLRSVVPGTFHVQGRPVGEGEVPAWEAEVERLPLVYEVADRPRVPVEPAGTAAEDDVEISPREGVERVLLRVAQAPPGAATTGVLTPEGPVFLPRAPVSSGGADSPDFWAERAARERLLGEHLPWLFMVLGAFSLQDGEEPDETGRGILESMRRPGPSRQALLHEGVELPVSAPLGTLAMRELMAALSRADSRSLEFCRLLEQERPTPCAEEGERAAEAIKAVVRRAFPGEGVWCRMSRLLLVRALVGWWKGAPCEEAPLGWRWLPPLQRGPPGTRRWVPPRSSVAWEEWPGMAAVLSPVRFLVENEGQPVDGRWPHSLRLLLGFEVEALPTGLSPSEAAPVMTEDPGPPPVLPVVPPLVLPVEEVAVAAPSEPQVHPSPAVPDEVSFMNISLNQWLETGSLNPSGTAGRSGSGLMSSSMSSWLKREST